MKIAVILACIVVASCAQRPDAAPASVPITPRGDMPEKFRVRSMFSTPADPLMNRYNAFAEQMNQWVWDYSRGMNNTKAATAAEKLFKKLSSTPGWSPKPRYELEQPCEVQ